MLSILGQGSSLGLRGKVLAPKGSVILLKRVFNRRLLLVADQSGVVAPFAASVP
jgi:hypothetical protein